MHKISPAADCTLSSSAPTRRCRTCGVSRLSVGTEGDALGFSHRHVTSSVFVPDLRNPKLFVLSSWERGPGVPGQGCGERVGNPRRGVAGHVAESEDVARWEWMAVDDVPGVASGGG